MGGGDELVKRLAAELRSLWKLRWSQPNTFGNFSEQPNLAKLMGLSGGHRDVEKLRRELTQIADQARSEEKEHPPEHNRSLAHAWTSLLKLEEKWDGTLLKVRQAHISGSWRTAHGKPIRGTASVKENFEPGIYEELARRLLARHGTPRRPRATRPLPPQAASAPWPGSGPHPKPGQEIIVLIAANAKRRGPHSGLIRLVREFEPYWRAIDAFIYSLEGSHREIWRSGLLHDYESFVALPAGFYGGLVHATEAVIAAADTSSTLNCHVVYLVDPHDNSSLYPATHSIKRQCILNWTPFLTTYQGAARWFRLDWARRVAEGKGGDSRRLLVAHPSGGVDLADELEERPGSIALASHDRYKRAIMDFADAHAHVLTEHFSQRWSTQVTGHLLNGGSIRDEEYENDILYDVKEERREHVEERIEEKTKAWREQSRENGPGSSGWSTQLTRGRRGGVIQLARKILDDECETILFMEDAETPGDQDMEIQMLDRAAQLADGNTLLLYDERSANHWAENLTVCSNGDAVCALTLVEAYRRVFDVELVLAGPDHGPREKPNAKRVKKGAGEERTWRQITTTAAIHLLGVLLAAANRRAPGDEPVRLGLPWGGAIRDVIGDPPGAQRAGLAGAIGLRHFVAQTDAASLYHSSHHPISAEEWPPLDRDQPAPFDADELLVVPTVGVIGSRDRSLEAHSLVNRTTEILGGSPISYSESAFAFRGDEDTPLAAAPTSDWENLDALLITAAPLRKRPAGAKPGALATGLPVDLADHYKGCDCAVGTVYLERTTNGVEERSSGSYVQVGISTEQIRDLKRDGAEVILVNGVDNGVERRRAAWTALKAELVSTFVTDEDFAWAVLKEEIGGLRPPGRRR